MQVSLKGMRVMFGMPLHRGVPGVTFKSMWAAHEALLVRGVPCDLHLVEGSSLVHHARSRIVADFLAGDATHLFWIDSDMEAEPAAFLQLLARGVAHPVVTAAYRTKTEAVRFPLDQFVNGEAIASPEGLLPVWGGIGFTVCRRDVLEAVSAAAPRRVLTGCDKPIPHIFRFEDDGVSEVGEDFGFFRACRAAGFQPLCDPTIALGHHGTVVFRGALMDVLEPVEIAA